MGLMLLGISETQGVAGLWLHLLGGMQGVGRLAHGMNFSFGLRGPVLRVGGAVLTVFALGLGAVLVLPP